MKIRSVTCFANVDETVVAETVRASGEFAAEARERYTKDGYTVQSSRFATQPINHFIRQPKRLVPFACEYERACSEHGIDSKGLGAIQAPARGANLALLEGLGDVIAATENVFAAVQIATRADGINLRAVHATARLMRTIADKTAEGIGNFRFAALANVSAGAPFFPAAYAGGNGCSFSIGTEAADLAVRAFSAARSLDDARERLVLSIKREANALVHISRVLARRFRWKFNGIDFTLAPHTDIEASLGAALERLTGNPFGERMTLFATAFITDCIRRARFPRAGFCGVFLPVLEDGIVAARSHTVNYSLDSLLLYSSVCGTGLDTIPLPGNVSADELAAILLDLATLAVRLDKPLTARLLPIPKAQAGDSTQFDFRWFANARVMETRGGMTQRWADANEWVGWEQAVSSTQ